MLLSMQGPTQPAMLLHGLTSSSSILGKKQEVTREHSDTPRTPRRLSISHGILRMLHKSVFGHGRNNERLDDCAQNSEDAPRVGARTHCD